MDSEDFNDLNIGDSDSEEVELTAAQVNSHMAPQKYILHFSNFT